MKIKHLLLNLLFIGVFCPLLFAQGPTAGKRNVLLLIADDMGIDLSRQYTSITGNAFENLPATTNIRKLADSGITFTNAWSNPVCSPTRAGFLTGQHSFRTGVTDAADPDLPLAQDTLPELLNSTTTYKSGLFGKWHLGDGEETTSPPNTNGPQNQGFDIHQGILGGGVTSYASWTKFENGSAATATEYPTRANVRDAFNWIDTQTGNWFAIVAFNAPHTPLHLPTVTCDGVVPDADVDEDMTDTQKVFRMIECMDRHIGWLLVNLKGVLEDTTVIFIGDNGTEGNTNLSPFADSLKSSFKGNVYEGGIRVPFIVSDGYHYEHGTEAPLSSGLGRIVSPGRDEAGLVHTVDIFDTVIKIAGETSADGLDSVPLIPYLENATAGTKRDYVYTDRCSDLTGTQFQAAIRDNDHKLIYIEDSTTTTELYETSDLEEANALDTSTGDNKTKYDELLAELQDLWDTYNPADGCTAPSY